MRFGAGGVRTVRRTRQIPRSDAEIAEKTVLLLLAPEHRQEKHQHREQLESPQQHIEGQEDFGLVDRLLTEIPGITNWALLGDPSLKLGGYSS